MTTERAAPDTLVARPPLRSLVDDLHERRERLGSAAARSGSPASTSRTS